MYRLKTRNGSEQSSPKGYSTSQKWLERGKYVTNRHTSPMGGYSQQIFRWQLLRGGTQKESFPVFPCNRATARGTVPPHRDRGHGRLERHTVSKL
jgi:hypothetical protein